MEKHPHKTICSDCKGNGFIYINVPSYVKLDSVAHAFPGRNRSQEPSIEEMNSILKPS
jgi:hypothetical protein